MSLKSDLQIAEICILFDELMQQGVYFDEFVDIAFLDLEEVVCEDFYPILESALRALGVRIFNDQDKANNYVIFYHLDRIVNKGFDPQLEAATLYYSLDGSCNFELFGPAEAFCITYYNHANAYHAEWRTVEEEALINEELICEAKKALQAYL